MRISKVKKILYFLKNHSNCHFLHLLGFNCLNDVKQQLITKSLDLYSKKHLTPLELVAIKYCQCVECDDKNKSFSNSCNLNQGG